MLTLSDRVSASRRTSSARIVSLVLTAGLAGPAYAQVAQPGPTAPATPAAQSSDQLQEVVVTGTQIHGVNAPIGSSLLTVDAASMEESGLQSTADILRSLPFVSQIGPGESLSNSAANLGTLNITRAQGVDLRGLGVQATLNLLDGRRVVPGGEGAQLFDPSSIPQVALQRIEIVPDGASATYGTDAVAGVVNYILRKNFDGAEIDASDGFAKDFSRQVRIGAIVGHTWDTGSVMIAGEFFTHPQLLAQNRPTLYNDDQTAFGGPDLRNLTGAPGNVSYNGTLYGLPPGNGVGVTPADFSTTVNKTSQWAQYSALPRDERHSVVLNVQQRVADGVNLWLEGYYTERRSLSDAAPLQETSLQVPSTNPFFIAAAAQPCNPGTGMCNSVNYSFINDLGAERVTTGETAYQLALGMTADLGHNFTFELYGTTNQDNNIDLFTGINTTALASALADSNPATALNVYGSGGNNNPATLASLLGFNNYTSHYALNLVNAKIDGPVYDLPGGQIRVAIGSEFHSDLMHNYNYGNTSTPSVDLTTALVDTTVSRTVSSAFGEAIVPLFGPQNAVTAIRSLELDVAGRFDHYSDFGSTTNPKIGLRWEPTEDFSAHASYGTSFRAPTLCDANQFCTAGVVTIPFPDLGWQADKPPSIFGPGVSLTAIRVGGNPALKPETATTYSAGLDWHPQWLHATDISLDFYHIDYKDIIDAPAAFNPAAGLLPEFAPFIIRNPTVAQVLAIFDSPVGLLSPQTFPPFLVNLIVDGRRQNVGEALTSGFDLAAHKQWESPWGVWIAGLNTTFVIQYDYSLVPGAPLLAVLNTVQGSGNAYPLRLTARAQLGWADYGFSLNAFVNLHNSYTNTAPPAPFVTQSIASYTTADITAAYTTGDAPRWNGLRNLTLAVSAINVTDRLPPFALIGTQDFDATTGGPLGRIVTFELRKRF
jgi:iron complex outermembrane recepter protein